MHSLFLLDDRLPLPAPEVGKILQGVLGGVAFDHVRSINANHGWIARGLEREQADALVAALKAAGYGVVSKDERDLINVTQVLKIRRAVLAKDAIQLEVGLLGKLSALPWESLSLVSIGRVQVAKQKQVTTTKRKVGLSRAGLAMGLPMPTMKKTATTSTETQVDESLLIQLVFAEEGVVREISPNRFDYGYLGDRLRPTGRDNLRLFLTDLQAFATSAAWTTMATELARSGRPPHIFKGDKDLLRYTQWRVEAAFEVA